MIMEAGKSHDVQSELGWQAGCPGEPTFSSSLNLKA